MESSLGPEYKVYVFVQVRVLSAPASLFPLDKVQGWLQVISQVFFAVTAVVHIVMGTIAVLSYLQQQRRYSQAMMVCCWHLKGACHSWAIVLNFRVSAPKNGLKVSELFYGNASYQLQCMLTVL